MNLNARLYARVKSVGLAGRIALLISALLAAAPGTAREGTVSRAAELRSYPIEAARPVATLPVGTVVDIQGRRGFWLRVQVSASPAQAAQMAGQRGWIKFARIRDRSAAVPGASQKSSGGFFASLSRGVTGVLGGSSQNTQSRSTITTGIRGLSAGELEAAAADTAALQQLDAYQISATDAARFAQQGKLSEAQVAYLDAEPAPVAGEDSASDSTGPSQGSDRSGEGAGVKGILNFFSNSPSQAKQNRDEDEGER